MLSLPYGGKKRQNPPREIVERTVVANMDIRFNCPRCSQNLSVEERGAGMLVDCPKCNEKIEIPRSTAPPPIPIPAIPQVSQAPRGRLITCKDCGHKISLRAASCPACGAIVKRANYAGAVIVLGIVVFFAIVVISAVNEKGSPRSTVACLDFATAKPALDNAGASLDACVRAAKNGDTATAASHIRNAAASLRTAASAESADAAISDLLMRAAESYDKAAAEYARGYEAGAALYAAAAIEFVKTSNAAFQHSSVSRCQ
jgi:transcription elongation factor Elf1